MRNCSRVLTKGEVGRTQTPQYDGVADQLDEQDEPMGKQKSIPGAPAWEAK